MGDMGKARELVVSRLPSAIMLGVSAPSLHDANNKKLAKLAAFRRL